MERHPRVDDLLGVVDGAAPRGDARLRPGPDAEPATGHEAVAPPQVEQVGTSGDDGVAEPLGLPDAPSPEGPASPEAHEGAASPPRPEPSSDQPASSSSPAASSSPPPQAGSGARGESAETAPAQGGPEAPDRPSPTFYLRPFRRSRSAGAPGLAHEQAARQDGAARGGEAPAGQAEGAPATEVGRKATRAAVVHHTGEVSLRPQPPGSPGAAPELAKARRHSRADSGAARLVTQDVCAWFDGRLVLEGVSLTMERRTVTALIGPSGCGKSTFLRILNRMHEVVNGAELAGTVELDGVDIYGPAQRATDTRRRIGMVFQKPNPFPAMTIYDNVLSGTRFSRIPVSDKDSLVEECLTKAGLWTEVRNRLKNLGGELSGGQQQRLCIARALAVGPSVLLMDEPCSALDPTSTRRIEQTIAEVVQEVTIVIVTHNMQQAQRVSQNCAFFLAGENEPGRVVESGTTEQIFEHPVDPRTSDYVHGRFG